MAVAKAEVLLFAKDRATGTLGKFNKTLGLTKNALGGVAAIAGTGLGMYAAVRGFQAVIKAASDAEEIQSKFDTVFKELSDDANTWAENFGSSVGRANQEVRKWMSGLQDTFVPLGFARDKAFELSQQLTQLAVDVASFNNEADDTTINAFTSAIVGNHMAVRRYGIVLTDAALKQEALNSGYTKGWLQLKEYEKAQVRLNLIMKSSTDAQGDALRTSKSYANQIKRLESNYLNLKEALGVKLLPEITAFVEGLNENSDAIDSIADRFETMIDLVIKLSGFIWEHRDAIVKLAVAYGSLYIISNITAMLTAFKMTVLGVIPALVSLGATLVVLGTGFTTSKIAVLATIAGLAKLKAAALDPTKAITMLDYKMLKAATTASLLKNALVGIGVAAVGAFAVSAVIEAIGKYKEMREVLNDIDADIIAFEKRKKILDVAAARRHQDQMDRFEELREEMWPEVAVIDTSQWRDFTKTGSLLIQQFREGTEGAEEFNQTIDNTGKLFENLMESSSQWYDEQAALAKKQMEHAAEVADAYRSMRGEMGEMTQANYLAEVQIINDLKTKYEKWKMDQIVIDQWYAEQKRNLDMQLAVESENLWAGFTAGMQKAQDDMPTLGQIGENTFSQMGSAWDNMLQSGLDGTESWSDAFKKLGDDAEGILRQMLINILKAQVQAMILNALVGGKGGGGGILGVFGLGTQAETAEQGGIVGQIPTTRLVNPAVFKDAPHYKRGGIVGLRSGEVPVIAHVGEKITPADEAKKGGPSVNMVVNNYGNDEVEEPEFDGEQLVIDIVSKNVLADGALRRIIQQAARR